MTELSPETKPSDQDRPVASSVSILVVDDNEAKLTAIESALAPLGQRIVRATSGREALRHLLVQDFATVILDVHMPELDGFATAQMIRSRSRSSATPIIFISAVNIEEADAMRGYSLGAVDYICAPIIPEVLRAKVSVFVDLYRKTEEARLRAQQLERQATELEQSQRELRLSERMASIGTLCAGLGHDMGNLLLPVSVWLDSLDSSRTSPELRENLDGLRACIQYLRKLASGMRLMALDPSKAASPSRIDVEVWVEEIGAILRNALPRGVVLEYEIEPGVPPICMVQHRLAQALFNLVQNAGEALRGREDGRVRIWAKRDALSDSVRIGVSDNGPGMPAAVLAHCVEPFFTTKTRGISTGLGLSLVHGIVTASGSKLEINSSPAAGTTFSFLVEIWRSEPRAKTAVAITVSDQRLRSLAATMARSAGCRVIPRPDAAPSEPIVWIAEPKDRLDQETHDFLAGGENRHVIVLTSEHDAYPEWTTASITGDRGLASRLREVLTRITNFSSDEARATGVRAAVRDAEPKGLQS